MKHLFAAPVKMALAKDPGRRFLSAGAFRRALDAVCEGPAKVLRGPPSFRGEDATLLDLGRTTLRLL